MNAVRARHFKNGVKPIRMNSMMLCLGSNPSISILFSFCLFACLSSVSSGISIPVSGVDVFGVKEVDVPEPLIWRRNLAEEVWQNFSMILAPKRTHRIDPINDYKHYGGGWNISNKHYWASVGFTAAPFFVIAAIWFLLFGLCLFFVCLCYCCCRREPYGYSSTAYALSLIFLIFFTISAIVGCIVLYTGQGKFHGGTTSTLDYVVNQSDQIVETLGKVSDDLAAAKQIRVSSVFLPTDVQTKIDDIDAKINAASNTLSERTRDDSKKILDVLELIRKTLIILSAVMLLLAFLGFLFSILGLQCLVYSLVIIGWILVAGMFILCGVFLLLHDVVADTCVAMDEWVQNPTAHTALDDILPCVDNATAKETLVQSKNVTYQLVSVVNTVINDVANADIPPNFGPPLYYNQSGPSMPVLCNPFNPDLTDRQCMADESQLNNASEIWKNYICQSSASGICTTPGRLTATYYDQMVAAVNISNGLYRYGPFLVNLIDCTFVRDTFTDISRKNCPGLRKYTEWIYIGLVMVSVAVMLSLIFWVIYARERRHRVYTKQHMAEATEEESKRP